MLPCGARQGANAGGDGVALAGSVAPRIEAEVDGDRDCIDLVVFLSGVGWTHTAKA